MFYFSAKSFSFGGGSKFSSGGISYPSGGSYSYGGGSSWCPPKKPVVVNCPPKKFGFDFGALLKCFLPVYLCPPTKPKPDPKPEPKPDPKPCVDCTDDNPDNSFGGVDKDPGNVIKNPKPDEVGAIYGTKVKDTIYGTDGADIIYGLEGADVIYAGNGNDIVYGGANGDTIYGGYGNDTLYGQDGNDYLNGNQGHDKLYGGKGDDIYMIQFEPDEIIELPGEGTDTVRSFLDYTLPDNVENLILMSDQNLNGTGNELNNVITGNSGNNTLKGMDGNDMLFGKDGNDKLYGGNGDDYLDGGNGNDYLNGGEGSDTYVFDLCDSRDIICDYDSTGKSHDVLQFGEGIKASDLGFSRSGSDLLITVDSKNSVTVENWFKGSAYRLEEFSFTETNTSWDSSAISKAIQEQIPQTHGLI
jgi:Ca2+-binding RTX toxin-like protein